MVTYGPDMAEATTETRPDASPYRPHTKGRRHAASHRAMEDPSPPTLVAVVGTTLVRPDIDLATLPTDIHLTLDDPVVDVVALPVLEETRPHVADAIPSVLPVFSLVVAAHDYPHYAILLCLGTGRPFLRPTPQKGGVGQNAGKPFGDADADVTSTARPTRPSVGRTFETSPDAVALRTLASSP